MSRILANIRTALKDPRILPQFAKWTIAGLATQHRVMELQELEIGGFPNFSSYLGAWRHPVDPAEQAFLLAHLPQGGIGLDVGANYGIVSAMMHSLVAPTGVVYAFEPVPATFSALKANMVRNRCKTVRCLNRAVGAGVGTVGFTDTSDPATNRIDLASDLVVQMDSLDHFCAEQGIDGIDFLKVDVEGAELQVLEGGRQCFEERLVSAGLIEVCPRNLAGFGATAVDLFELLSGWGYYLHWVDAPQAALTKEAFAALPRSFWGNAGFQRRD